MSDKDMTERGVLKDDKDMTERGALKDVVPNAIRLICLFHTLRSFNPEISTEKKKGLHLIKDRWCLKSYQN